MALTLSTDQPGWFTDAGKKSLGCNPTPSASAFDRRPDRCLVGTTPSVPPRLRGWVHRRTDVRFKPSQFATVVEPPQRRSIDDAGSSISD